MSSFGVVKEKGIYFLSFGLNNKRRACNVMRDMWLQFFLFLFFSAVVELYSSCSHVFSNKSLIHVAMHESGHYLLAGQNLCLLVEG